MFEMISNQSNRGRQSEESEKDLTEMSHEDRKWKAVYGVMLSFKQCSGVQFVQFVQCGSAEAVKVRESEGARRLKQIAKITLRPEKFSEKARSQFVSVSMERSLSKNS